MSQENLKEFEEKVSGATGLPVQQIIENQLFTYEGLSENPFYQAMIAKALQAEPETNAYQLAQKLRDELPKIGEAFNRFEDFFIQAQKEPPDKKVFLSEYDAMIAAAKKLKQVFADANQCYVLTFPDAVTKDGITEPFNISKAMEVGRNSSTLVASDDAAVETSASVPLRITSQKDLDDPDSRIKTGELSAQYMQRDTPYARAIKSYLTFEALVAEPEFIRLKRMVCGDSSYTSEEEKLRFGITHEMQEEYFNYFEALDAAASRLQHLIIDDNGERRTRINAPKLEPEIKDTAEWLGKELPKYVDYLNEIHAIAFDKDEISPVFNMERSQHAAITTMAQFHMQEVHHASWGHRYH
jgi:hypothetical protein